MKNMIISIVVIIAGLVGVCISAVCMINGKTALTEEYEAEIMELRSELTTKTALCEALDEANIEYFNRIVELERAQVVTPETVTPEVVSEGEPLPDGPTNFYPCMDYRKITNKASEQWQLQEECWTCNTSGIRIYYDGENNYYCAALGSAYGRTIGDTWRVTLECGSEFDIVLADFKDDGTTEFFGHPCKNYDGEDCINIVEFVVDMDCVPESVRQAGTMGALDYFGGIYGNGGNIVKMEYTGKVWNP